MTVGRALAADSEPPKGLKSYLAYYPPETMTEISLKNPLLIVTR
jgi:hypothetical protein